MLVRLCPRNIFYFFEIVVHKRKKREEKENSIMFLFESDLFKY